MYNVKIEEGWHANPGRFAFLSRTEASGHANRLHGKNALDAGTGLFPIEPSRVKMGRLQPLDVERCLFERQAETTPGQPMAMLIVAYLKGKQRKSWDRKVQSSMDQTGTRRGRSVVEVDIRQQVNQNVGLRPASALEKAIFVKAKCRNHLTYHSWVRLGAGQRGLNSTRQLKEATER